MGSSYYYLEIAFYVGYVPDSVVRSCQGKKCYARLAFLGLVSHNQGKRYHLVYLSGAVEKSFIIVGNSRLPLPKDPGNKSYFLSRGLVL